MHSDYHTSNINSNLLTCLYLCFWFILVSASCNCLAWSWKVFWQYHNNSEVKVNNIEEFSFLKQTNIHNNIAIILNWHKKTRNTNDSPRYQEMRWGLEHHDQWNRQKYDHLVHCKVNKMKTKEVMTKITKSMGLIICFYP